MSGLSFPPLFQGLATAGADPFYVACSEARTGCDAGLVAYDMAPDRLRAAIVFAPEVSLEDAMIMLPICGIGFQNALGALAPPEVGVHLEWGGGIRVNGGQCGTLKAAATPANPAEEPDWLVIGLEVHLWSDTSDTGLTPDVTSLYDEGCAEVEAPGLLEAWVRHTLVWINRWSEDGVKPLHAEWLGLAHGLKDPISSAGAQGTFLGVDENFGLLLQHIDGTAIIPISTNLRDVP